VKAGQIIDCLDTEHIWCQATVELKIQSERSKEPLILVHYEGWSRKYDELLNISSKRVAPKGLYTDRQDIPRYRMCNQDRNPVNYAHVIYNPL
jgi:hypothetical protein